MGVSEGFSRKILRGKSRGHNSDGAIIKAVTRGWRTSGGAGSILMKEKKDTVLVW